MKPLVVLIATFILTIFSIRIFTNGYDLNLAGRIAMSAMLLFTAIGHFAYTKGMTMMMPGAIPFKKELVYVTGLIEILAAIGLFIPTLVTLTGWLLIVFFISLLPANMYAALNRVDYQKGTFEGPGKNYLWFRVPLQVLFIVWIYLCAIKN